MKVSRLEQTGAIKLLLYLEKQGEANMREIIYENKQILTVSVGQGEKL
ncbi:MAG: hypothetical protein ACETWM_16090 [Candidatus Lokiarchaeia archaeon]